MIAVERPAIHTTLAYTYATVWFTTPFFGLNAVFSALYILPRDGIGSRPLGRCLSTRIRSTGTTYISCSASSTCKRSSDALRSRSGSPFRNEASTPGLPSSLPSGLARRPCRYPYIEELLKYQSGNRARKAGGLVLDVKGDFCWDVYDILERHDRSDDYIEVSLTSK
jgi:hypothetical protein